MNKLTIVTVPEVDWEGLYVNGILVEQAHKIRIIFHIAKYCPISNINEFYYEDFNEEDGLLPFLKDMVGGDEG